MTKDLTTSQIDRQNILNNDIAIAEIQQKAEFNGVLFKGKIAYTKEMLAQFFEVDVRTVERYMSAFADELKANGYTVLRGKELKSFLVCYRESFGTDINVATKITVLGIFDFRAFLNLAMLLA